MLGSRGSVFRFQYFQFASIIKGASACVFAIYCSSYRLYFVVYIPRKDEWTLQKTEKVLSFEFLVHSRISCIIIFVILPQDIAGLQKELQELKMAVPRLPKAPAAWTTHSIVIAGFRIGRTSVTKLLSKRRSELSEYFSQVKLGKMLEYHQVLALLVILFVRLFKVPLLFGEIELKILMMLL